MSLPADYHMHTPLCRHASGTPSEYAAQAIVNGLSEIGFSDHSPMRRDDFDDWRMAFGQLDEYCESVRKAAIERPGLTIKLALEVDYLPGQEDWIRELSARHPWDYLIGSVHYVSDGWALDNPQMIARWETTGVDEVWESYFDRLTMAAESRLFDIIGHADLPKKFGFRPKKDCGAMFDRFLKAARRANMAIELNTAGLRKPCREIYPSRLFLDRAFAAGIPITFGSDAHASREVGADFVEAVNLAREAGYRDWRHFEKRAWTMKPL